MRKPKLWKGEDLEGHWSVTLKLDGVRMLRDDEGNPVSRSGKPLYNLDHIPKEITDAEVFERDWETSVSLVRSSVSGSPVELTKVYPLDPPDDRIILGTYADPTAEYISNLMDIYVGLGYEGLVLRKGAKWLKVKPEETADVLVTGYQAGTGKHEGRLGALLTNHGKVGTGFTDTQREEITEDFVGSIIEVRYMEITPGGKMRHPRFVRVRTDRNDESLPWTQEDS